ncbi:MAG: ADP-ribosylation factor-like protein [Promethearchaeota archaeon]
MDPQTNILAKVRSFFKDDVDLSSISKPSDVLDLPFNMLKVWDASWEPFFEELDLVSIKDLAQYQDPLVFEGLNPDETNKFAMICELIFWHMTQLAEHGEGKKKIIFLGLGNAGKTSALTALSEKYSAIKELLPTRGLQRQNTNILGYELVAFDFGGQSQYRDTYFEKADMYFTGTDMMIYIIDIQDPDRYEESLEYYQKILDTLEKNDLIIPILVVFSKMDPDIANDEDLNQKRLKLMESFEQMSSKFDIGFAISSIYERNSIENLFSLALKKISTSGGVIQELLKVYVKDINARACVLISSTGLVFGSYGETHQEEEMLKNSAAYLQNLYLFHLTTGLQKEDFYELNYKRNNLHFISEYITSSDSGMVYLWVLTTDLREEVLGIQKFREDLIPLINLFL